MVEDKIEELLLWVKGNRKLKGNEKG